MASATAHAAPGDAPSRARGLFREARQLATDGKYADACPKFEESLSLDPGIGTKFNLADCWEHLDRTASAQHLFVEVADLAHEAGQAERETAARARASALDAKLSHLTIQVAQGGLEIRRNGTVVPPAEWNLPQPIDPGKYDLVASAPGKKQWTSKVEVAAGAASAVAIPDLESEKAVAKDAAPEKEEEAKAAPPAEEKSESESNPTTDAPGEDTGHASRNTMRIALYVGAGVGASLAVSSFITYKLRNDAATDICPSSVDCTQADVARHSELVSEAKTARVLGFVGLGIGGASLVGAALLTIAGAQAADHAAASSFSATPIVGADGSVGGVVHGTF
jgi:hypothetical protein